MTAILAPTLEDRPAAFIPLSQLVIVTAAIMYSWFTHRGYSFHRDSSECRFAEQRETVS